MARALVVFSGGPDSTAAALWGLEKQFTVELLTFQYKHKQQYGEIKSSIDIASALALPHTILDIFTLLSYFSPNAHIMMHSGTRSGDSESVTEHTLPFGTGMILSIAANYAVYKGFDSLIWGATKDDGFDGAYGYSKQIADDIGIIVSKTVGSEFTIYTPFHDLHKHEIIGKFFKGRELLFAKTWSCKKGGAIQSGDCAASVARRIAARLAGIEDSTRYEVMELPATPSHDTTEEELAYIMGSPREKEK